MDPIDDRRELLSSDSRETLQFFFAELRDVTSSEQIDEREILYSASVLAHFASTSATATVGMPTPRSLSDIFDRFVLHDSLGRDPEMLEMAAGQCLLLTGFFGDQLRRRHNLEWYGRLGSSFYRVAAATSQLPGHRQLLRRMAADFPYWRAAYGRLSRELRANRLFMVGMPEEDVH